MSDTPSRKLAVIMHADVVGSTKLVRQNETLAHQRIKDVFRRFSATIESYGGTTHELRGDAVLVEFARTSDAVCAALAFHDENTTFNSTIEDELQPRLRVGIAMGEVVIADNTITGDGVVLAQRLEQIADPSGVCIQGAAYETIPKRLPFSYKNLGDQRLKGFEEAVRAYSISLKPGEIVPSPEPVYSDIPKRKLPGKPSIAVLPFTNMSGDPEQVYFSDGITEDIITELSRFRELFITARNSAFAYKGQSINVSAIGEQLGVAYIIEGSVRKVESRVRITAQLVEAASGNHLWAERYDRKLDDIFAVQDEVVQAVVAAIPISINLTAREQSKRKPPESLNAYEYLLQGIWLNDRGGNHVLQALSALEKSVEIDPTYARAWGEIAYVYFYLPFSNALPVDEAASKARQAIERALALDDNDAEIHSAAGQVYLICGEYDRAKSHSDRAVDLNPNDEKVIMGHGLVLGWLGAAAEGQEWIDKAIQLNQEKPGAYLETLSDNLYMQRNYEGSIEAILRWRAPPFHMYAALAASYAQLGRMDEAATARAKFEATRANHYDIAAYMAGTVQLCKHQEDRDHWIEGFRKAGFMV